MSIRIIEELDSVIGADIYGLSWYMLYLLEARKIVSGELINRLYLHIRAIMEEHEDALHVLLYDREVLVGVLLGYYILLKKKYNEFQLQQELSRVLKIVKNTINEYMVKGEILYALKKLSTLTNIVKEFINVDDEIITESNKLKAVLTSSKQLIEELENLLYVIWIAYEADIYDKSIKEQELLGIFLSDRFYDILVMDYKSLPIYACALSNFVLSKLKPEREVRDALYERLETLMDAIDRYIKDLEQKIEQKEIIDIALIGKLKLSLYYLEKALQKLRTLDEVQKVKRKYGIPLAIALLVIVALINLLAGIPWVILLITSAEWVIKSISIMLGALALKILDDIMFGGAISGRVSKAYGYLRELIKLLKEI